MLKKIVHIVLVLLLTVATSGFTISEHYCGGHLFSVSLFKAEQCSCGNHCKDCHTTTKQIKVSDNYSVSEAIHPDAPTSADLFSNYNIDFSAFIPTADLSSFFLYQPPPPEAQNLFALFQSFRC
jgi:hypothetical protein